MFFDLRSASQQKAMASSSNAAAPAPPLDMASAYQLEALTATSQTRLEALYGPVADLSGNLSGIPPQTQLALGRITRSVSDRSRASGGDGTPSSRSGRAVLS